MSVWQAYPDNASELTKKGAPRKTTTSLARANNLPKNARGFVHGADTYTATASFGVLDKTSGRIDGVICITNKSGRIELTWPQHALFALPGIYPRDLAREWVEDAAVILDSYDNWREQKVRSHALFIECANDIYKTIKESK